MAERMAKGEFCADRLISRFVTRYHIAVSQANAKYLIQTKGLPQHKVIVIRNGCDPVQFTPNRPEPQASANLWGSVATTSC